MLMDEVIDDKMNETRIMFRRAQPIRLFPPLAVIIN